MRLWTLHPRYLDAQGLVALWRESLLAQQVLTGRTRGYREHPQLLRFRESPSPMAAIGAYLEIVHADSRNRGYNFNRSLIAEPTEHALIDATAGQLRFEAMHLRNKLAVRSPELVERLPMNLPDPHPLFRIVPGPVEPWEGPATISRAGSRKLRTSE